MIHGTEKTTFQIGDSTLSDIKKFNGVYGENAMRNYRIRVKVADRNAEFWEYIQFTEEIAKLKAAGRLTVDKDDMLTYPTFIVQYPKVDLDGSYFVIKCYTVFLDS